MEKLWLPAAVGLGNWGDVGQRVQTCRKIKKLKEEILVKMVSQWMKGERIHFILHFSSFVRPTFFYDVGVIFNILMQNQKRTYYE